MQNTTKATARRGGEAPGYFHYEVRGGLPGRLQEFQQTLLSAHGEYMLQVLEILEWVCPTDRQFEKARGRVLKISNGQERTTREIIRHLLAKEGSNAETG